MINQTINNLKDRPKEDRQAVAIGGAGLVVLLLIVGWGYIFIKRLQTERLVTPADIYPAEQTQAPNVAPTSDSNGILQSPPPATNQFGQPTVEPDTSQQ